MVFMQQTGDKPAPFPAENTIFSLPKRSGSDADVQNTFVLE